MIVSLLEIWLMRIHNGASRTLNETGPALHATLRVGNVESSTRGHAFEAVQRANLSADCTSSAVFLNNSYADRLLAVEGLRVIALLEGRVARGCCLDHPNRSYSNANDLQDRGQL